MQTYLGQTILHELQRFETHDCRWLLLGIEALVQAHLIVHLHPQGISDEGLDEVEQGLHLSWLCDLSVDRENCLNDLHSHALRRPQQSVIDSTEQYENGHADGHSSIKHSYHLEV